MTPELNESQAAVLRRALREVRRVRVDPRLPDVEMADVEVVALSAYVERLQCAVMVAADACECGENPVCRWLNEMADEIKENA